MKMRAFTKAALLGLAIAATGATGALAGKSTTPNATQPTTVSITVSTIFGLTEAEINQLRQRVAQAYGVESTYVSIILADY